MSKGNNSDVIAVVQSFPNKDNYRTVPFEYVRTDFYKVEPYLINSWEASAVVGRVPRYTITRDGLVLFTGTLLKASATDYTGLFDVSSIGLEPITECSFAFGTDVGIVLGSVGVDGILRFNASNSFTTLDLCNIFYPLKETVGSKPRDDNEKRRLPYIEP